MNWHTEVVTSDVLERLLATIRAAAGTIINCTPQEDRVEVTWTALS